MKSSLLIACAAALLLGVAAPRARADGDDPPPVDLEPSPDVYIEDLEDAPDDRKTLSLGLRAGGWFTLLEAEAEVGADELRGTEIDLTGDLDLDEYATVPYAEAFFTTRFFAIRADYWRVEREGEADLGASLSFGGKRFDANTPVEGRLSMETAGAWVEVTPFSFDSFHLGLVVGARYYWLEGAVERQSFPRFEADEALEGPVPIAGVTFAAYPGPFEIYGRAQGFYLEYADDDLDITAGYADVEVGVAFNIGDHLAVGAGYKGVWLEVEELGEEAIGDEQRFAVLQHGPVVWLRLRL